MHYSTGNLKAAPGFGFIRLLLTGLAVLIVLSGCGGRRNEIIEDCEHVEKQLHFTEELVYLSGNKTHNTDPFTYQVDRELWIHVYDSGAKSDLEQFGMVITPTEQSDFLILGCYEVISYGYVRTFAGSGYSAFVLVDRNGLISTIPAFVVNAKHWKDTVEASD